MTEELYLLGLAQAGDDRARAEIIKRNIDLAYSIASNVWNNIRSIFPNTNLDELDVSEDIIKQEAVTGLIKGIDHFDVKRGDVLYPYIKKAITRTIIHYLLDCARIVRVPEYKNLDKDGLRKAFLLGDILTHDEMQMNIFIEESDVVPKWEFRMDIRSVIDKSKSHEKTKKRYILIVKHIMQGERNLTKIGKHIGLSRQRVHQLLKQLAIEYYMATR